MAFYLPKANAMIKSVR